MHDGIQIIHGFFSHHPRGKPGAAFGMFADSPSQWKIGMLMGFSIIAMVIVSALLWKNSHAMTFTGVGLALILGGAVGNLWDRLSAGKWSIFCSSTSARINGPRSMWRTAPSWWEPGCLCLKSCSRRRQASKIGLALASFHYAKLPLRSMTIFINRKKEDALGFSVQLPINVCIAQNRLHVLSRLGEWN